MTRLGLESMFLARTTRFKRGKLPHWEVERGRYFIIVRLADSLPHETVLRLQEIHRCLAEIEPLLPHPDTAFDEMLSAIQALTPRGAKGLEFDRVVLVEPALIAAGGVEGLRGLYVALTRATKTLVVVHAEPLPAELLPA